jgi:hypothetical protein
MTFTVLVWRPGADRDDLEGEIERRLRDLAGQAMLGA